MTPEKPEKARKETNRMVKTTKKKAAPAAKKPRTNKAAAIYDVLANYERAMHLKSMATDANKDSFVSNYKNIVKSLTDEKRNAIAAIVASASASKPSHILTKQEKKALRSMRTTFMAMLESAHNDAAEPKPEHEMSKSEEWLRVHLGNYCYTTTCSSLGTDLNGVLELCDKRAKVIIDALPEDLRPKYGNGAKMHALYEILREIRTCGGPGMCPCFEKVEMDVDAIYQAVVDYGNENANTNRKHIAHHLEIMDMFLFCILETLTPKELDLVLPTYSSKIPSRWTGKFETHESEEEKEIHRNAIIDIYTKKEILAKRYYHPTRTNTIKLHYDDKKPRKRDPRDFLYIPPISEFLNDNGIRFLHKNGNTADPVSDKYELKIFSDEDRKLIKRLLESKDISVEQKRTVNKTLQLMDKYHEKYEGLRETLVKIKDTASKDLET